jgi:uncharacterized protein (DUF2249 family)
MNSGAHLLDVSMLEPPEPMQQALAAIDTLAPGEYLCLLHRREPLLLYPVLEKRGFSYRTEQETDKPGARHPVFRIYIWRSTDDAAGARVAQTLTVLSRAN